MSFFFKIFYVALFSFLTFSPSFAAVENCKQLKSRIKIDLKNYSDAECQQIYEFYSEVDKGSKNINLDSVEKQLEDTDFYKDNKEVTCIGQGYSMSQAFVCEGNNDKKEGDLFSLIEDIANGKRGDGFSEETCLGLAKAFGAKGMITDIDDLREFLQDNLPKNANGEYTLDIKKGNYGNYSDTTTCTGSASFCVLYNKEKITKSVNEVLTAQKEKELTTKYLEDDNYIELMKILAGNTKGEDFSSMSNDDFRNLFTNDTELQSLGNTVANFNAKAGNYYKTSVYEKTLAQWRETGGCWVCPLFSDLFDTSNWLATNIYEKLRMPVLSLFSVGLALWLAFKVMQYVTTFYGANFAKFITEIAAILFKGIIVGVLLNSGSGILSDYIISPLVSAATEYSEQVMSVTDEFYSTSSDKTGFVLNVDGSTLCSNNKRTNPYPNEDLVFGEEIHNDFSCLIRTVGAKLLTGMSVGTAMLATIFSQDSFWEKLFVFRYPDVLFVALMIVMAHALLIIVFPFKLIEVFIRFAIVGALLPIFIIAWPFPSTRGISEKGKNLLITSLFTMIGLVVFVTIGVCMIMAAVPADLSDILTTGEDLKNGEILKQYRQYLSVGQIMMIPFTIFACAYISIKMLNMVPDMTKKIFGSKLGKTSGAAKALFGAAVFAPKQTIDTYRKQKKTEQEKEKKRKEEEKRKKAKE